MADQPKVLTPAEAASAVKRAGVIVSVKYGSLHTTELETRSIARALICADATITRLRGLIEGMGHEAGCRYRQVSQDRPGLSDRRWCNCIKSKVNL